MSVVTMKLKEHIITVLALAMKLPQMLRPMGLSETHFNPLLISYIAVFAVKNAVIAKASISTLIDSQLGDSFLELL